MSSSSAPVVELRSVGKSLGGRTVLKEVSLSIPKGSVFGVIGENGSGKSTLLELMIGFLTPDKGSVHILCGSQRFTHDKHPTEILEMCGFSPQQPSLCDDLTVRENLSYFGRLWNLDEETLKKNRETILEICTLKPWADMPALALSAGIRKRVDIACALIHNPEVLFLDDPTSGLDKKEASRIFGILSRISKAGEVTIILATSSIDDASNLCTRVALLRDGALIGPFHVNDILKRAGSPKEVLLQTREAKYQQIASILSTGKARFLRAGMRGPWFVIQTNDASALLHDLLDACKHTGQAIVAIQMDRPGVRDAIKAVYGVQR